MTTEVYLRAALLSDLVNCADIHNVWIDDTSWLPRVHPRSDMERHYREDVFGREEMLVVEAEGGVAGFLALSSEAFISSLYVRVSERGKGIGGLLVDAAKERRSDGLSLWTFEANVAARRFYEQKGFVERRHTAGDNEERLPDVLLHWLGRTV
jgi:GNAT superfamily N-acetyltransferase